jgi:hypothetical protein
VFHSASIWVNGSEVGGHLRNGYTAFEFDITSRLHPGTDNTLVVRVNSDFDNRMLPRGHSSDWTHDGGIYRPIHLMITPRVYIQRVGVDAVPDLVNRVAGVSVSVVIRNSTDQEFKGKLALRAVEQNTGLSAAQCGDDAHLTVGPSESVTCALPSFRIADPKLWYFDAPNLYSLSVGLSGSGSTDEFTTTFGIRSIEVKEGSFWLNCERMRLMGLERMAGSNPTYGMAEPTAWIDHDHDDLKQLNCVFTRVHWPQDKRVLDYFDRNRPAFSLGDCAMRSTARIRRPTSSRSECMKRRSDSTRAGCYPMPRAHCSGTLLTMSRSGWTSSSGMNTTKPGTAERPRTCAAIWKRFIALFPTSLWSFLNTVTAPAHPIAPRETTGESWTP